MDHLSSCYFCGAALDDPIQEYAVVPPRFRSDDTAQTTATLCPTCHEKLERVLDAVVTAATDSEPPTESADAVDADDLSAADVSAMAGDLDARLLDDDSETDTPDADAVDDAARAGGTDSVVTGDEEPPDSGLAATDSGSHGDESAGGDENAAAEHDSAATTGDEPDVSATDKPDVSATDEPDVSTTDTVSEPEATDTENEPGTTTDTAETGASPTDDPLGETTDAADEQTADAADESAPDADDTTTVSALEYNKVMRLLQNRQFPVDREEIETVAANAYGLSTRECAQVIDLAVDRGLIGESGEQLVRPD